MSSIPVVLSFSGSDPTGGAGIQADIETMASLGCHCASVVTSVTAQNTINVLDITQILETMIIEQARAILEDMEIKVIKIGLITDDKTARAIHSILMDYQNIPVVLDPILYAGAGGKLSDLETLTSIKSLILPLTTIITPNSIEARSLAPEADTLEACAMAILERGCEYVLVTGSHENTKNVCNTLYGNHRKLDERTWPRINDEVHGTGCTLASAIAAYLAHGQEVISASHQAQEFTWKSIKSARQLGMGQKLPNRFHWLK